jgi:adenosylcobinamide-GDP ribazoletransferase
LAKKYGDKQKKNTSTEGEVLDAALEDKEGEKSDFLNRLKYTVKKQGCYADLKICIQLLTRLPVYISDTQEGFSISGASRLFPIVGAIVGIIAAAVLWVGSWFTFPSAILALLALLTMTLVTGALHEDGLADTFDGLGGGLTREQKLSIMRDSQIGSYGVMALLFSFGLRWAALTEITEQGFDVVLMSLIATAAASRAALPAVMHFIPVAREDGLSVGAGKPSFDRAITALLIGVGFLLFLLGFRTCIVAIGLSALVAGMFVYFVAMRLGGQTGDVLGATQQITETTIFLAILIVGFE